jgi:hypothetical protein
VSDAIGKFSFQTNVAGGVQFGTGFLLLFGGEANFLFEDCNFVLFAPEN